MDDRQIEANLEAARAKTRSIEADLKNWQSEEEVLKADYARQQNLWDLGLTSQEQLQHAKYKAESDQWDIKRVPETLNTAHRRRAIAGTGTGKDQDYGAVRRADRAAVCARGTER